MAEKTYVVIAMHDTGHGPVGSPIGVTSDIVQAVRMSRAAEKLGYEFYDTDASVAVYALETGRAYGKAEHSGLIGQTAADVPWIFVRRLSLWRDGVRDPHWNEDWYSDGAEAEYRRRISERRGGPGWNGY